MVIIGLARNQSVRLSSVSFLLRRLLACVLGAMVYRCHRFGYGGECSHRYEIDFALVVTVGFNAGIFATIWWKAEALVTSQVGGQH